MPCYQCQGGVECSPIEYDENNQHSSDSLPTTTTAVGTTISVIHAVPVTISVRAKGGLRAILDRTRGRSLGVKQDMWLEHYR
jgi:hypothetical protein